MDDLTLMRLRSALLARVAAHPRTALAAAFTAGVVLTLLTVV